MQCPDCGNGLDPDQKCGCSVVTPLPIMSPSGTALRHTENGSNWVRPGELERVARALALTVREGYRGSMFDCKYVAIRVDMRTGHFVVCNNQGDRIDGNDEALKELGIHAPPKHADISMEEIRRRAEL